MGDDHNLLAWTGNIVSVGAIVGSIVGYAPAVAAIVALVWYMIQIFESETVRRWTAERRTRKIARLKARVIMMEARSRAALPAPPDEY